MECVCEESAKSMLDSVLETQRQIEESRKIKHGEDVEYYGWYSEEVQASRIANQTQHNIKINNSKRIIKSPPYTYWLQGDKKVLVTDVTNTQEIMERHIKNNAIFLGKLHAFCCRSYTKL
jgi:hypothetical protein